jgi:hypothetical protein
VEISGRQSEHEMMLRGYIDESYDGAAIANDDAECSASVELIQEQSSLFS